MTEEMDLDQVKFLFDLTTKDCPWTIFHVVDLDNYKEQMKDEMIHAYLVIPQWCERPKKSKSIKEEVKEFDDNYAPGVY
jgi:hypothetical protein